MLNFNSKLPARLEHDPIIDCVIEMHFQPSSDSVSDILPGLLFGQFRKYYPKTQRTAEAQIPKSIRIKDNNLKYTPSINLIGDEGSISIADAAVALTVKKPYPGWKLFKPRAIDVFKSILETELIKQVERVSIKYNNILAIGSDAYDLSSFEIDLNFGRDLVRRPSGTMVRAEFELDSTISIVQLQGGATAHVDLKGVSQKIRGVHLLVNTLLFGELRNIDSFDSRLEMIHSAEKKVFFSMIKESAINMLGPEWSDE